MTPCVLIWLTIGAVSCARFPLHLPRRGMQVIFVHHNTAPNASHSAPYRHSMRSFYQHLFNFLDDSLGFDYYDTVENYNKSRQDPWVHITDKGNISGKFNDSTTVEFQTSSEIGNKTETTTLGLNMTSTSINTDKTMKISTDGELVKVEESSTANKPVVYGNGTTLGGDLHIKRIRREYNSNNVSNVTNLPIEFDKASDKPTKDTTSETVPVVNFGKGTFDDDFTSSVEKMIAFIDEQLENKSQAVLRRFKRVGDLDDDGAKIAGTDVNVEGSTTENKLHPEKGILEQSTVIAMKTTNIVIDSTTYNQSNVLQDTTDSTAEPTKDSSAPDSITEEKASSTLPVDASDSNTTVVTSAQVETNSFVNSNSSNTADLNVATQPNSILIENKTTAFGIDNTTETTSRSEEIFEVPDGMSEEPSYIDFLGSSIKVTFPNHTTKGSNVPPNDSITDNLENEVKKENGSLRKMIDSYIPGADDSDIEDYHLRMESNGDFMKALVIPIFLVVLMGALLFAMHSMRRDFIQRTNTRRADAAHPDRVHVVQMQMTSVATPMEEGAGSVNGIEPGVDNKPGQTSVAAP